MRGINFMVPPGPLKGAVCGDCRINASRLNLARRKSDLHNPSLYSLNPARQTPNPQLIPIPIQSALASSLNITCTTPIQERLISSFLAGRDIIYKDATGSGKTMGLVISSLVLAYRHLSFLSSPHYSKLLHEQGGEKDVPDFEMSSISRAILLRKEQATRVKGPKTIPPSILWMVPNRELGMQIYDWMKLIIEELNGYSVLQNNDSQSPELQSLALDRWIVPFMGGTDIQEQLAFLSRSCHQLPRIVLATPSRLFDIVEHNEAKSILHPSTLILDEVDTLIEYKSRFQFKHRNERQHEHPNVADQLIKQVILNAKKKDSTLLCIQDHLLPGTAGTSSSVLRMPSSTGVSSESQDKKKPKGVQLVTSSATLNSPIRFKLKNPSTGLMNDPVIIDSLGSQRFPPQLSHEVHVLKTKSDGFSEWNLLLDSTRNQGNDDSAAHISKPSPTKDSSKKQISNTFDSQLQQHPENVIAHVAQFIKNQDIKKCVVFFPDTVSVAKLSQSFSDNGIKAFKFSDMLTKKDTHATLFDPFLKEHMNDSVVFLTKASLGRGLDLPGTGHVIILGKFSIPRDDMYVHMSGRASRFGQPGRTITLIGDTAVESNQMRKLWKRLGLLE